MLASKVPSEAPVRDDAEVVAPTQDKSENSATVAAKDAPVGASVVKIGEDDDDDDEDYSDADDALVAVQ